MIKPLSPEILKAKVAIFVDLHLKTQLLVQAEQLKKLNNDLIQEKVTLRIYDQSY
jgi:hypothetical protein